MTAPSLQTELSTRNRRMAFACVALVAGMVGMAYAAVPLYRLFCQVTGYGGTTQRADVAPNAVLDRVMSIRFDSNVGHGLRWDFRPEQREIEVKVGEPALAFYRATNLSDRPVTGSATFNVTPPLAGAYFMKIECFCFTEQTLAGGQTVEMPVQFFVDPSIAEDEDLKKLKTITLSYTFYPAERPVAQAPGNN